VNKCISISQSVNKAFCSGSEAHKTYTTHNNKKDTLTHPSTNYQLPTE